MIGGAVEAGEVLSRRHRRSRRRRMGRPRLPRAILQRPFSAAGREPCKDAPRCACTGRFDRITRIRNANRTIDNLAPSRRSPGGPARSPTNTKLLGRESLDLRIACTSCGPQFQLGTGVTIQESFSDCPGPDSRLGRAGDPVPLVRAPPPRSDRAEHQSTGLCLSTMLRAVRAQEHLSGIRSNRPGRRVSHVLRRGPHGTDSQFAVAGIRSEAPSGQQSARGSPFVDFPLIDRSAKTVGADGETGRLARVWDQSRARPGNGSDSPRHILPSPSLGARSGGLVPLLVHDPTPSGKPRVAPGCSRLRSEDSCR